MATSCQTPQQFENRGMMWMIGAFVFCPCHLPITLSALALLLGGTAAGALLRAHPYIAGAVVTLLWAAGTWRGLVLVRRARYLVPRSTGSSRSTGVGLPSRSSVTR
jgi:cytochrome c biogenesis protein CcdA